MIFTEILSTHTPGNHFTREAVILITVLMNINNFRCSDSLELVDRKMYAKLDHQTSYPATKSFEFTTF